MLPRPLTGLLVEEEVPAGLVVPASDPGVGKVLWRRRSTARAVTTAVVTTVATAAAFVTTALGLFHDFVHKLVDEAHCGVYGVMINS